MKLSIVVPVFNEENTVNKLIEKVLLAKLPKGIVREIIIIDDGSSDSSWEIIDKLRKKHSVIKTLRLKQNCGKGFAVRAGINLSKGDLVLIQDADLEYDPSEYKKLLQPIIKNKAKVVYGTRLKSYPVSFFGKKRTPLITHFLGNKLLTFTTNFLYGSKLTDMETCYKLFSREVLTGLTINSKRFEFEPEITAKILKKGFNIVEVPIKVKPRGYDEGKKISWLDGFSALATLLKYRFSS